MSVECLFNQPPLIRYAEYTKEEEEIQRRSGACSK